ncbi:MAG: PDZ domain-containing protein [Chloroherpetonaceae bacterium]|nr:PDZ domain-containing protein [Chloroherpetonaceae bacterium]MDW8437563.1 PDZ domain-containing protein [Chloroherpetonaceae bacterium]
MQPSPSSSKQGYYRQPALHQDRIVFVSEDDLWEVSVKGGVANRLTATLSECSSPAISPDGKWIAFTSKDEGHPEVYVMQSDGGNPKRLTFLGATLTRVLGWKDGYIIFTSNAKQAFRKFQCLMRISLEGGEPQSLKLGHGVAISFGKNGGSVIGRNSADAARWKRYKGGTAGEIWLDKDGSGKYENFSAKLGFKSNFVTPIWIDLDGESRIYFVSDHDGIGNIYSASLDATDLKQHTFHDDYYVRYPQKDGAGGNRIVYHAGADLFIFDAEKNAYEKIDIQYRSPFTQRNRKFVDAQKHLETYFLHPDGERVAITTRGHAFGMHLAEGAVTEFGKDDVARYRLAQFLHDGKTLVVISDASGEERLELYSAEEGKLNQFIKRFEDLDIGRALMMRVSPKANHACLSNHRQELFFVDLDAGEMRLVAKSKFQRIGGFSWSPDGKFIAYGFAFSPEKSAIEIYDIERGESHRVTNPVLIDEQPCFDVEGKYLYFLSKRVFNPVYDDVHFDLNFPRATKPYLITLRKDLPSPFLVEPKLSAKPLTTETFAERGANGNGSDKREISVQIDFDGIAERVVEFPVPEGRYVAIGAAKGKAFFLNNPIQGAMSDERAGGALEVFRFDEKKRETLFEDVESFELSPDGKTLVMSQKGSLRYAQTHALCDKTKETKQLNLSRIRLSIVPLYEWTQMYREAWRLQRDQFWTEDMSKVDWNAVYHRYLPLLARVASRVEFSDLMWEMQGELGTSHAYEMGGDYRPEPKYPLGFLGADVEFDAELKAYRIAYIPDGDHWEDGKGSSLKTPGANLSVGDLILGVNGTPVSERVPLGELLVNQAATPITLTVADKQKQNVRSVVVKTLASEEMLRYRDWVNRNAKWVREKSEGKVGYVHVPNMQAWGYAEFHRAYLAEYDCEGLIVDVRFNGGGHVSQLLLEKLNRKRLGYDVSRWNEHPEPYPAYATFGNVVALTNEFAGSDGDIFSHSFKMMKLGTLVGKRTWGGVIGIYPRHALADGGLTTQPEFSFWFFDVGWGVENYGTDPDVFVDIAPHDYCCQRDPQLEKALELVMEKIRQNPARLPDFTKRPNLALPKSALV